MRGAHALGSSCSLLSTKVRGLCRGYLGDRSKLDGSLNGSSPLPPKAIKKPRLRLCTERKPRRDVAPVAAAPPTRERDKVIHELLKAVNDVHRDRNCHEVTLAEIQDAVDSAQKRNPGVKDVPLALIDLFRRYPEDIPLRLGVGQSVRSPLKLMATRDLQAYVRKVANSFDEQPPKIVLISKEEEHQRKADVAALFGA